MEKLKVKILSSYNGEAFERCVNALRGVCEIRDDFYDIIICPDYDSLLTEAEIKRAKYGALVFHPSPLPRMRGKDAIKRQYKAGDKVGGGTWFWAEASNFDRGDICEQECCIIDTGVRPREYYLNVIIPIMERGVLRAINGVIEGRQRKIKQITWAMTKPEKYEAEKNETAK